MPGFLHAGRCRQRLRNVGQEHGCDDRDADPASREQTDADRHRLWDAVE
jgi:hypothetical protein